MEGFSVIENGSFQDSENEDSFSEGLSEKLENNQPGNDSNNTMKTKNKIKIGNVEEFSVGEDWNQFQENFNQLLQDTEVIEDERKVVLLITLIGKEAFKILKELCYPEQPLHQKYEDLCNALELQFAPKKPIFKERKEFYEMSQNSTESVTEWYNRVIEKAVYSKFDENVEKHITKDKFVIGLYDTTILGSLIQEDAAQDISVLFNKAKQQERESKNKLDNTPTVSRIEDSAEPQISITEKPKPLMDCVINIPGFGGTCKEKEGHNKKPHSIRKQKNQSMRSERSRPSRDNVNKKPQKIKENIKSICNYCGGTNHVFNKCHFKNNAKTKYQGAKGVCPHLHTITDVPKILDPNEYVKCSLCESSEENYVCLHCYKIYCARFVNKHAFEHGVSLGHPLCLNLNNSSSIWCYQCEAYIENPGLKNLSDAFGNLKL